MPFRSRAQAGFLAENHPGVFDKFKDETPPGMHLPEHVGESPHHKAAHAALDAIGHIADQMRMSRMHSKMAPPPTHQPEEEQPPGSDLNDEDMAKLHEFRRSRMK